VSHLDTYRTQSGPQTRRERVQPTATGPLQSPLCVRGRRNPARDPRFPITADPHPSPHLTLDSTASRLTCPLTCATAPPETATGTAAASTDATTGEEVRRPTIISDRRVPFFQLAAHPQPNKHPVPFPNAWCHPCRPRHRAIPAPIAPGRARRRSSDGSTIRCPGTRAHARVAAGVTREFPRVALIGNPKLREELGVSVFVWL